MQFGVVFPQTEIGSDPGAIRDYAQAAEGLGYTHLVVFDHVLGANPDRPGGWNGPYTFQDSFHEPFVLFGFLAALTRKLQMVTGILILPQRQTALVAKQAAAVDVLSGGRLVLGIGIGWNEIEYEALGQDFHQRGRRVEEQIALLRRLWTEPVVQFEGRWDRVPNAGISPLPVQQPIPIWMGGMAETVLQRAARLADGWFPQVAPGADARELLNRFFEYARRAGRDPSSLSISVRVNAARTAPDAWAATAAAWKDLGATHVAINTMRAGFRSPAEHIDAIRRFMELMKQEA